MNKKDTAFCSFIAGAACIGGLVLLSKKINEAKKESTITVDGIGNVTDIHLVGEQNCSRSFIEKKLPHEMKIARMLQEQHFYEHPDGVTMIIR